MSHVLYLASFCVFLGLAAVVRVTRAEQNRRRALNAVVLYLIAVYAVLAAARRDAWPFATHGAFLESGDKQRPFSNVRFFGVDALDREHPIDSRSWLPLQERTLDIWWLVHFERLDAAAKRQAMEFLLAKAEGARRAKSGLPAIAAPPWYSVDPPRGWPATPYVGIRAYLVTRIPVQKAAAGIESSRLLADFHQ